MNDVSHNVKLVVSWRYCLVKLDSIGVLFGMKLDPVYHMCVIIWIVLCKSGSRINKECSNPSLIIIHVYAQVNVNIVCLRICE